MRGGLQNYNKPMLSCGPASTTNNRRVVFYTKRGTEFSKLDLREAYVQLEVSEDSRKYLVLNTPFGMYECNRLMYGVASAPAIWQREMENLLRDIPGVAVFLDDIRVTAPSRKIHLQRLEAVLERLSKHNIRVNLKKCEFLQDRIEYCGYVIDRTGLRKSMKKIKAIQDAPRPTNKMEVKSFVGLVNYYGRFFKNLSEVLQPLYHLLKDDIPFRWNRKCQKAFNAVKEEIQSDKVLAHFDPTLDLILATDASAYAVGAVLSQISPDGIERPIQFASQMLSKTQQRYSQIDKEAYAIIYGVKKFYYYLYGRKFTLIKDHKPLVRIFSPTNR